MTGEQGDLLALIPSARPIPACAHDGVTQAEQNTDAWTRAVLRQAIQHLARTRPTFTADDLEDVVRDCRPNQIGAAVRAAAQAGIITPTGTATRSTRQAARGRLLSVWTGAA